MALPPRPLSSSTGSSSMRKRREIEDIDNSNHSNSSLVCASSPAAAQIPRVSSTKAQRRLKNSLIDQGMSSSETKQNHQGSQDEKIDNGINSAVSERKMMPPSNINHGSNNVTASQVEVEKNMQIETEPTSDLRQNSNGTHANNGKPNNEKDEDAHKTQLIQMLKYRNDLLQRIRQCRDVADIQLDQSTQVVQEPKSDEISTEKSGEGMKDLSNYNDEREIDGFRKMARTAAQILKRQRPEQHAVENPRPTVTLRRGASVGKKMNAAVSSLTGNATYLTSDSSSSPTFTLPAQPLHLPSSGPTGGVNSGRSVAQPSAGLTVTNPVNSASQDAVITPSTNMHGVSIATPVSSSHHVHPPSHLGSSMNMKQNLPLPIASGDGNRKGEISSKQRRSSATAQKNKRLSIQKNMKNNSMGQTSDSGGQVSSLPLHYGLGTSVLPHPSGGVGMGKNQQQMRQGSSSPVPGRKNVVICHEAMALRERRNAIRSKLGAVLYDQLNKIERSGKVHMAKGKTELSKSSVVPSPVTKVQRNRGVETKKNPFTWAMVNTSLRGPGAPAQLPQRRKTQWDYVLEEMRWLATDFIEERKWKAASSQTLSCAVRSRRSIPLLSKPNQRPVKKKSTDGEKQKVSILNQSAGIEELETTPSVNLVSPVSVAVPKIEYYKESKSADKAFSRMKAKLLSVMVTEHWDTVVNGGIFAASDETYATSFLRYRRLEKSIDRMVEQHSIEISGNDTLLSVEEHNDEKNDSKIDSVGKDQMDVDMNGSESDNLPSHTKDELSRTISESPSDANWSDGGNRPRSIELSHEAITKSITSSIEQIKNIRHDSDDRYRDDKAWDIWTEQLDGCGVKLNLSQLQACHLVEELWCCVNDSVDSYDFGSGAILSGSAGCGKTIAIGGMLWKQRQGGPQLVLCPPASLIRWRQSLSRYNDLNVFTFGEHGGSYDYNSVQRSQSNMLGPRDILLCEFSCFHVLLEQFGCESNSVHYSAHSKLPFSTFILDSRHQYAAGDLASMRNSKSTVSGGNLTNTKKKQSQSLGINTTGLASLELASLEWWNNLLGAVSNSGVRRLLVHRYPSNPCRPEHYFEWFPDEKQGNELLACVAAFVHNPGTFHSQNISTSRKVASWAKRLSSSNLKGKSKNDYIRILDLDPTDPGARGVLKSTLSPVFISLNNEEKNSSFGWDIRFCTLSEAQRRAYDSCCSRARGALSVSGSMDVREVLASNERPKKVEVNVNHYMLAAQALLRIRRVCLHSHIGQLLRDKLQDNSTSQSKPLCDASLELVDPSPCSMHRNHWLREKPQNVLNASQPNFLLAQEIMDHSSKMKELLTILYFECGYHFTSEEMFLSMLKEETGFRKVKDMNTARRKVVVLATLPEAQLLTSIFLNAVGIRSEVMLSDLIPEVQNAKSTVESYEGADVSSPVKGFDNRVNTKVSTDLKNRVGRYGDAIAGWVMCQTVLARFDKNTAEQGTENTGGILISSPVAVSGLHSGLDSAAGEVVISLDEDWSGREALFLSSIQTRHIARHSNKVPTVDVTHGVHFIKIISRDTCEHEFLFNEKEARRGISQVVKEKEKVRNIATRKTVRRGRSASKVESTLDSKVNSDSDRKRDKDDGFIQPFQSIRMMMTDEYGYVRTPNPHLDQSLPDEKPLKGSFLLSGESRSQLGVASNVLRYRNVKLSILLRTHEPLPADFVYGKDLRFIPYIGEGYRTGEISENANHGHNVDKMNDLMMDIRFSEALAAMEALASPLSVDSVTYNQEKHVGLLKFGGECVGKNRHGFSHLVVAVPLLPSIFPPTVVSRRDTVSIKARLYMQHFGRSLLSCASGDSLARTTCISSHQTEPLFLRSTPAAQGDAGINNAGIDLAEGWRRSGLSCKVNDIAASFLVYKLPRSPRGTRGVKRPIDYGALEDRDIVESHDKKQAADHALDSTLESCGDEVHVSWKKQRQLNGKCDRFDFDLMSNGNGQRSNVYSISFGASQEARSLLVRDGNVGCEPLLYFPPLFPGMRQCSQQVSLDLDYLSIDSRAGREPRDTSTEATQLVDIQPSMMSSSDQTRKRSHYATNPPSSGKRPRVSTLSNFQSTGVGTSVSHTPAHSYQPAPMTGSLYSESRTEHNDPNSIPKLIEPGIITEDEVSESDAASMLVKLNDDFGLVGLGALPHALDSAKAAASVPIETASYRQWDFHGHSDPSQADVLSGFCVCDSEEVEMTNYSREQNLCLQGMLLFVKKRSPSVAMRRTPASFHHQGVLPAASSPFISESLQLSVGAPGNSNAGVRYFEGSESMRNSNKKTKKNQQHSGHTAVSAYPPLIHAADVKDGYRNYSSVNSTNYQGKGSGRKFTSAGAYFSTGTMRQNETLSVRLAIVRIRQQISNHVSFKLSTASQPGPGVPLLLENRVAPPACNLTPTTHLGTSTGICRSGRPVCAVLKLSSTSKQTGDFAQSESITQREALRRSMIAPCRVDFGPFQSGFLSSARGMTGISPPRSRVGITLPMGVKLPQRQKEHGKQDLDTSLEPWNTFEDQKLKECIQQFGLNWHLASRYLTGDFDNKYNPNHEHTGHMRSARQCSERWKILARRDTSISIDFRVHEHKMRDMSRMTVSQIVDSLNSVHQKSINNSVLLSTGFQKKTDRLSNSLKHENVNAADGNNLILSRLKRMSLLKMASTKKQEVHITIPGYVSGTLPDTPTHKSHMQSIQSALSTSTGPGGIIPPRAEMWPLQLLELADDQFAANVAAAEKAKQEAAAARSQQSSSSSIRRQQVSGVAHSNQSQATAAYRHQHQQLSQSKQTAPVSSATQSQQELIKQAARAAAMGSSSSSGRSASRGGNAGTSSQHQASYPAPQQHNHHPAPVVAAPAISPAATSSSATPEVKAAALAAALGKPKSQNAPQSS